MGIGISLALTSQTWVVAQAAPAAPGAFSANQWAVLVVAAGWALDIEIAALPADNGAPINLVEYRTDGGQWQDSGITTPGIFRIAGLTNGVPVSIQLRAANSAGPAALSDLKSATPNDSVPPVLAALTVDGTAKTVTIAHDEPVTLFWARYDMSQTWAGADDQARGSALESVIGGAPDSGTVLIPAAGTYSIDFAGLAAGDYFISYVKKDTAGNYSAIIQNLAAFPDTTTGGA